MGLGGLGEQRVEGQQVQPEGTWRGSGQDVQDDDARVAGDPGT